MTESEVRLLIIALTVTTLAAIVIVRYLIIFRNWLPGFRGAVGFKNSSSFPLMTARVSGFRSAVVTATLAPSAHSFQFLDRQPLPSAVEINWRTSFDRVERAASVSLESVGHDLRDGEIFFVFSDADGWTIESAPELRLERLQQSDLHA
jgi:hypothetical protein